MYYQRRVTEMEKSKLLLEFTTGSQSVAEFTKTHRISTRTFYDWLKKFEISPKSITFAPRIGTKADLKEPMKEKNRAELEAELAQVKKDLEWAKLQNLALNTMIDIAEEQGIQIRKKSGAKQ